MMAGREISVGLRGALVLDSASAGKLGLWAIIDMIWAERPRV